MHWPYSLDVFNGLSVLFFLKYIRLVYGIQGALLTVEYSYTSLQKISSSQKEWRILEYPKMLLFQIILYSSYECYVGVGL